MSVTGYLARVRECLRIANNAGGGAINAEFTGHAITTFSTTTMPLSTSSPAPARALASGCSTSGLLCDNCGEPGHTKMDCWSKVGGKEGQRPRWANHQRQGGGGAGAGEASGSAGNPSQSYTTDWGLLAISYNIVLRLTVGECARVLALSTTDKLTNYYILTYSDFGASHHYFRDCGDLVTFVTYEPLSVDANGARHSPLRSSVAYHAPTRFQNIVTLQFDLEGCDIRVRKGVTTIAAPDGFIILRSKSLVGDFMYIFALLPPTGQEIAAVRLKSAPSLSRF